MMSNKWWLFLLVLLVPVCSEATVYILNETCTTPVTGYNGANGWTVQNAGVELKTYGGVSYCGVVYGAGSAEINTTMNLTSNVSCSWMFFTNTTDSAVGMSWGANNAYYVGRNTTSSKYVYGRYSNVINTTVNVSNETFVRMWFYANDSNTIQWFVNTTVIQYNSTGADIGVPALWFGSQSGTTTSGLAGFTNLTCWKGNITDLVLFGNGTLNIANFTFYVYDDYPNPNVKVYNFSAEINGTVYYSNTSDGSLVTPFLRNESYFLPASWLNISILSFGFKNYTFYMANVSNNTNLNLTPNASLTLDKMFKKVIGGIANDTWWCNDTTSGVSWNSTNYSMNVTVNTNLNFLCVADGYLSNSHTVGALSNGEVKIVNVSGFYNSLVNFSAWNNVTGSFLTDYAVTVHNYLYNYSENLTTAGGNLTFGLLNDTSYFANFSKVGYARSSLNFTVVNETAKVGLFSRYVFDTTTSPSLRMFVFKESNVSQGIINFTYEIFSTETSYYTTGSSTNYSAFKDDLITELLRVRIMSDGYANRTYIVNVPTNDTNAILNAYLPDSGAVQRVLFVIKGASEENLPSALLNFKITGSDGSQYSVTSDLSDVAGQIYFSLVPTTNYGGTLSKSGYTPKTFTLLPISTEYTLILTGSSVSLYDQYAGGNYYVSFSPENFLNLTESSNVTVNVFSNTSSLEYVRVSIPLYDASYCQVGTWNGTSCTINMTGSSVELIGRMQVYPKAGFPYSNMLMVTVATKISGFDEEVIDKFYLGQVVANQTDNRSIYMGFKEAFDAGGYTDYEKLLALIIIVIFGGVFLWSFQVPPMFNAIIMLSSFTVFAFMLVENTFVKYGIGILGLLLFIMISITRYNE